MTISNAECTHEAPVAVSTGDVATPGTNLPAVVTYAAGGSGIKHCIGVVAWSYDGLPTNGGLKIEDGSGNVVFQLDVIASGAGLINFQPPKKGAANTALVITLAAGGSGIKGKVSATHWTETDPVAYTGTVVNPPDPPAVPTATKGTGSITVRWTAPSGSVTSYSVYRSTSSGSETSFVSGVTPNRYVDESCVPGTTYYYKETASNTTGESSRSSEVSAVVTAGVFPGTLTNSPTYTSDVPSSISTWIYSLIFVGGSTQYITCGGSPTNDLNQFTLCLRFRTSDNSHLTILAAKAASSHQSWTLYNNSGSIGFVVTTAGGSNVTGANSVGGYADGNWHDALVVVDGIYQTLSLYLDGALAATGGAWSGTWNSSDISATLTWGHRLVSGTAFTGSLCDGRIYDSLLSASDIAAYHAGTPLSTVPVVWYKMNENTGNTAKDSGLSWLDGVIVLDGNSLTTGAHIADSAQWYPNRLTAMMPSIISTVEAVAGQTTEAMVMRYPSNVSPLYNGPASRNIVVAWEGINSLTRGQDGVSIPDTPAQAYAAMANYIALAKATGFKVLVLTMIKCDTAVVSEANRLAYNALVLANSANADAVLDIGSMPEFQDINDTNIYYTDKIHVVAAGAAAVTHYVMQQLVKM